MLGSAILAGVIGCVIGGAAGGLLVPVLFLYAVYSFVTFIFGVRRIVEALQGAGSALGYRSKAAL